MSDNNTLRTLQDVIKLDGWIAEFDNDNLAQVHMEIVFRESRFGGNPGDKVRFSLSLKRAEIHILIPKHEPIQLKRGSTLRQTNETAVKRETKKQVTGSATIGAEVEVGMTKPPRADLNASAGAAASFDITETHEDNIPPFAIQHLPKSPREFGWEVTPNRTNKLSGSPWHPDESPIFKIKRSNEKNADGERPTFTVKITCRREDLEITNIETDDPTLKNSLTKNRKDLRVVAAEQLIKAELQRAGFLQVPDMTNPASEIIVADRIIMEEE